jgi:hypothetical protein
MLKNHRLVLALAGWFVVYGNLLAGVLQQDFSADPATAGWKRFGNTNLFVWDPAGQQLRVTWDSSQTNSYFYHSLGTVLARDDNFSLEFDLRLQDIATTTKPGPFEIAVGFINLANATSSNLWRGSGVNATNGARNILEFDYFPAGYYPDFGNVDPSVSPTVVSQDNGFAVGFALLELTNNHLFHVTLNYSSSNATLHTTLTMDGAQFGPVGDVLLDPNFSDFRLDSVAVSSYSDYGDDFDSVLAHGTLDNIVVRTPEPPVQNISGMFSNAVWQVQFANRSNWLYTVETTADFRSWTPVSAPVNGNGTTLTIPEPTPRGPAAFFRVSAQRP